MNTMIDFSVALLDVVAEFLGTEPIIYLFGMVLLCLLCKSIKILISRSR